MPLIRVTGLSHRYPTGRLALEDVSLAVEPGERIALLGESGAGKSTLARHLNGLLKPSAGEVVVDGLDTRRTPVARLAAVVGYVFQNTGHQLFAESVFDEIALGPRALGWAEPEVRARVDSLLAASGMDRYRDRHPLGLSEGERRRVAINSTLAARPRVLVLDEPTIGQDQREKGRLVELLDGLAADGVACFVITHDIEFAAEVCPRWLVMAGGRLLADGQREAVLADEALLLHAGLEPPQLEQLAVALSPWGYDRAALSIDAARDEVRRILAGGA